MSNSPQIARSILGQLLKKYRLRASLTASEASRETGISEPKLRKLERGANDAVRLPDIYACGSVYTCESLEISHMKDLALGAHQPGWYHEYNVPAEFAHFIELEGSASEIHIHQTEIIHGLFQIPAYIEALRKDVPNPDDAVETGLRVTRQSKIFNKPAPPKITYITSESALRRNVGDRSVMAEQIRHLVSTEGRSFWLTLS